ncbi:MAG TPA: peptidase [bacterium]
MKIVFIFIDGLGIGEFDVMKNPCANPKIRLFNIFQTDTFPKKLPFDGIARAIDAQLGVPGIPQSATGQAALFTGINAVQHVGQHLSGFPNEKLRVLIENHSIFYHLKKMGTHPCFINAYRPIFFEKGPEMLVRYLSVTSIMNWKAGLHFFNFEQLAKRESIYHDFTNLELIKKGYKIPIFTAPEAGRILARESQKYDFCLYEYFKTDWAGHAQNLSEAIALLVHLEQFIITLLQHIDLSQTLVVITSDHGNIEDISVRTHTTSPVPLILWGKGKHDIIDKIDSLIDIAPCLINS